MTPALANWISEADALRHLEQLQVAQGKLTYDHIRSRGDDYYLSLVGELFSRLQLSGGVANDWARLGNALAQFGERERQELNALGVSASEAILFAASAFYCGGFPASAYLTIKNQPVSEEAEIYQACFDLLARPSTLRSQTVAQLLQALRTGDLAFLESLGNAASTAARTALTTGPSEWIPARLFEQLVRRFLATNVRAILPDGGNAFWTPLIESFVSRKPPAWEFFPSQIQAFRAGLLEKAETFSLQMPTGAGKTAICETLLYWHAKRHEGEVAVLLVPYRSLASELRATLVKRLNTMGISARCAYGGTVPAGDEVHGLEDTRTLIATPEALSGLLSADGDFFRRISLVICDEGHLLDGQGRGVVLELLLSRLRARTGGAPRFVFASAIVPNIEEINSWLGGSRESVVRSDYRPALADFSRLLSSGKGAAAVVALEMHPHESAPPRFTIAPFLSSIDFHWRNPRTGMRKTYKFDSVKTQAIAAARKALGLGAAAVFAANKRGAQGAIGLAEELLQQLQQDLPLPTPLAVATPKIIERAVEYLRFEYGGDWVGTKVLAAGAVLHHGDIPQETREILEALLREGYSRFAICTSTLAEGVNLPIRTLVLYSVQRRRKDGPPENLLARDIKNLVGRAGRAGATTKGLVICANQKQWPLVWPVARQEAGEPVHGALSALIQRLTLELLFRKVTLDNASLEGDVDFHALIDGVDATLIDLAAEEIGEDVLVEHAVQLANKTFAWKQGDENSRQLLQDVFKLRANKVATLHAAGRIEWFRETGAKARLLASVENDLLPRLPNWGDVADSVDPSMVQAVLEWAWNHNELQRTVRDAYRLADGDQLASVRQPFLNTVGHWLSGIRFADMALAEEMELDDLLGLYAGAISFDLQTLVEHGIALLGKLLAANGTAISDAVVNFPEHLRFGVPTPAGRVLAAGGVGHRRAFVELGRAYTDRGLPSDNRLALFHLSHSLLQEDEAHWRAVLGHLVFDNTLRDLVTVTDNAA